MSPIYDQINVARGYCAKFSVTGFFRSDEVWLGETSVTGLNIIRTA